MSLAQLLKNDSDFKKLNPSLENIRKALELFAKPHDDYESVIIAGTNGKGTVASILEQLCLKYTDIKVGKFTSPHLISACERIRVSGKEIAEADLTEILQEIKTKVDFQLSYFEKLALAAYIYFSRQKIDVAILEVGMGGRWDCANAVSKEKRLATVITSIGFDHMEYLGDTLEKIRAEKEAIKREGVAHYEYSELDDIEARNFALAQEIFEKSIIKKSVVVDKEEIMSACRKAYRARFEYIPQYDLFLDSAHNPQAAKALKAYLNKNYPGRDYELHLAFLDKNYLGFVEELICDNLKAINLYTLEDERATQASTIKHKLENLYPELEILVQNKIELKKKDILQVYSGSIYFCGDVLKLISKQT